MDLSNIFVTAVLLKNLSICYILDFGLLLKAIFFRHIAFKKVDMDFFAKILDFFWKKCEGKWSKGKRKVFTPSNLRNLLKSFQKKWIWILEIIASQKICRNMIELVWIFLTVSKVLMWNSVGATIIAFSYHSEM